MSERAPIWRYAKAMGKALIHVAPEDLSMSFKDGADEQIIAISCTMRTGQEAEAVCEIIKHMAHHWLKHNREGVWGDIHSETPEPKLSYREELERAFGPLVSSAQTGGLVCVDCGKPRAKGSAARCRPCYESRETYAKEIERAANA